MEPDYGRPQRGGPEGDGSVRIWVDPDKCQGHGRCYALVPELFDVDDYGASSVRGDGVVPPDLEEKAQLAIDNCPEYAIEVAEE